MGTAYIRSNLRINKHAMLQEVTQVYTCIMLAKRLIALKNQCVETGVRQLAVAAQVVYRGISFQRNKC